MSDMWGQYGIFIDEHTWEYHGAWSLYRFDMKNMKCEKTARDGTTEVILLKVLDNNVISGVDRGFGTPVKAEFKRYQHWLFERVVLHD